LTKTLARELGPHGINVNCVAPDTFVTRITSSTSSPDEVAEHVAFRRTTNVLNRLKRLDELATAVLFPASDDVSYITGHILQVGGGGTD